MCAHVYLCLFLCLLMYMGNCEFTLLCLIPMQHKANSIVLPFCICSPFSHSKKPDFHYTLYIYLFDQYPCMQSTSNFHYQSPLPYFLYGWSPDGTQAPRAMLGYYHIHLFCVDILLTHPGLGNMYHDITPCRCPPQPCLGFDP